MKGRINLDFLTIYIQKESWRNGVVVVQVHKSAVALPGTKTNLQPISDLVFPHDMEWGCLLLWQASMIVKVLFPLWKDRPILQAKREARSTAHSSKPSTWR